MEKRGEGRESQGRREVREGKSKGRREVREGKSQGRREVREGKSEGRREVREGKSQGRREAREGKSQGRKVREWKQRFRTNFEFRVQAWKSSENSRFFRERK